MNHFDKENIELRQQGIDGTYRRLKKMALSRKRYLEDAIKLFSFYRECDEFQVWMKEKVRGSGFGVLGKAATCEEEALGPFPLRQINVIIWIAI